MKEVFSNESRIMKVYLFIVIILMCIDVVSDLDYSLPVTLQYYVSAETDSWDEGPFYTAYRPYRYKYTAPTDRPVAETFSTNLGTVASSEPNLDRSSYCNNKY